MTSMRARSFLLVTLAFGCTDARLFGDNRKNDPDKARIKGKVCTSDPADREFPVRVLFLVDTSVPDADYISQRGDSIEKVLRSYAGPNYSYAVIRYAGPLRGTICGFRNLSPDGFSKNIEEAIAAVRCSDAAANVGRDLSGALSLANAFISGDVLKTRLGVRSRTKYVVVLLANGPPTVSLAEQWCNSRNPRIPLDMCDGAYFDTFCRDVEPQPPDCERYQYSQYVREMRDFALDNGAQEFFFHVVYQRDPDQALSMVDDITATDLYAELALHGGGTMYRFPGPARCDVEAGDSTGCLFSKINLDSTQAIFIRKQLIVSNRSALATATGLKPDTDQDGIDDEAEMMFGTDPTLADTDGDFLSDRVEIILKSVDLDPLRNDLDANVPGANWPTECPLPGSGNPNAFPPDQDQDGDGLTDCEEILFRADSTLFDSDADGIPDPLELRYGTIPIADDALEDRDADGLANLDEYRLHLAPLSRDPNTDKTYFYSIIGEKKKEVVSFTQPFQVTGVYITRVSDASSDGRATVFYEPPPDPTQPVSANNPARLSWRDPQDTTPSGSMPGRGPDVLIEGDGQYVLHSAASNPQDESQIYAVAIDVIAEMLPTESTRNDVRLRRSTRYCFDFDVSDIQLAETGIQPDTGVEGVNFIDVFLAEVPQNNPTGFGVFRVATVTAVLPPNPEDRYPQPDIILSDEDFLLFGD